jgi:hypothetical protein
LEILRNYGQTHLAISEVLPGNAFNLFAHSKVDGGLSTSFRRLKTTDENRMRNLFFQKPLSFKPI